MAEDLEALIKRRHDELRGRPQTRFEEWRDYGGGYRLRVWATNFCAECALFALAGACWLVVAACQVAIELDRLGVVVLP